MKIRPLAAFIGAAALAAAAFAPAVTSPAPTDGPGDGLAGAFAAGQVDLESDVAPGDLNAAGVPFGVTVPCTAGFAGPFPCENVDLASYVPLAELGGGAGSDSWGWTDDMDTPDDTSDDRDIALYGTTFGLTYIDVTDPNVPLVLGRTTITPGAGILWRDVKVNDGHAYFVSEEGDFGVKVIDLTELRDVVAPSFANEIPVAGEWMDDDGGNAHNIWVNEATDRAYVLGTGSTGDQDEGGRGQAILDLSDPANPEEIGMIDFFGYTHDMECVIYTGPDADYNGEYEGGDADGDPTNGNQAELCFGANEKFMRVVDVTDASNPSLIATIAYQSASYTHQSVLTEDMEWLLWNDETDEDTTSPGTRTYWADISDLDLEMWQDDIAMPSVNDGVHVYTHDLLTVDHNMYITGDILWQANYNGGLQVFRISDEGLADSTMERIGYFDVDPGLDIGQYGGAWNVYPHFGQDKIIVSSIDEGLYVLQTDFDVGES